MMLLFFKLVGLPFPLLTQNFPSVISKIRYSLAVIERNVILVLYKNIVLSNYIIILIFSSFMAGRDWIHYLLCDMDEESLCCLCHLYREQEHDPR